MGDMTGARIWTALLDQESYCLFSTYPAMALLVSGDVELNPGPEMYTPDCKHGKRTVGDMIRCCGCATWFHEDCVGIESEEDRGLWPCPECRLTSANIRSLVDTINNLVNLTESISNRLKEVERQRNEDTATLFTKIDKLTEENSIEGPGRRVDAATTVGETGA